MLEREGTVNGLRLIHFDSTICKPARSQKSREGLQKSNLCSLLYD